MNIRHDGNAQAIDYCRRRKEPEDELQLNEGTISFVDNVQYLSDVFDRNMPWKLLNREGCCQDLGHVHKNLFVGFEVLTAVVMKSPIF
jgi:hypothetical protein